MVGLLILLLLDPSQHLAEMLVLDDGRVAYALQMVEDGVGQGQSLPADLQPAFGKVIDVDQLACHCRQCLIGPQAFKDFATHEGKTQSARHIKPLHWYIACRLVLEGGFRPEDIRPRPPFRVEEKAKKGPTRYFLHYDASLGGSGEQVVLGGLKTKNGAVVVNRYPVGPFLAVSCKGVTKAFRNLTNRMEETIGECTNLHITYPASHRCFRTRNPPDGGLIAIKRATL
jgi:hypothetical protein